MRGELDLPEPLTLRLRRGGEVLFTSEKHWLHPLFDLEAFLAHVETAGTLLEDRVTGRAAAFLVVRLGIPELRTRVLSRRAVPVLERHGVRYRCREEVERVLCATEDLLADVEDPEAARTILEVGVFGDEEKAPGQQQGQDRQGVGQGPAVPQAGDPVGDVAGHQVGLAAHHLHGAAVDLGIVLGIAQGAVGGDDRGEEHRHGAGQPHQQDAADDVQPGAAVS